MQNHEQHRHLDPKDLSIYLQAIKQHFRRLKIEIPAEEQLIAELTEEIRAKGNLSLAVTQRLSSVFGELMSSAEAHGDAGAESTAHGVLFIAATLEMSQIDYNKFDEQYLTRGVERIKFAFQSLIYIQMIKMRDRAKELLTTDPSGFSLVDSVVKDTVNNRIASPLRIPPIMTSFNAPENQCFYAGLRETADYYKKMYLIGARAGLGPMPT